MRCPFCGHIDQKVLESRLAREGEAIRRRRECIACGRRFTTFEEPEGVRLYVVKRDGTREEFSTDKCMKSLLIACRKRPVPIDRLQAAVAKVESDLFEEYETEVPTQAIGSHLMQELRSIDQVAFIRFASVYLEFQTLADFSQIIDSMREGELAATH
jgi:transcriptional repressor NrdR